MWRGTQPRSKAGCWPWPAPSTEGRGRSRTSTWPSSRCRPCCPRPRRMRRCGWCWRTTATTPPAANPARTRTPCWSWTSSAPSPPGWTRPSTWPSGSATSASRSWSPPNRSRASATTAQAPRLLASCAGGIVVQQCPDPERLLALAGMVRTLEHNWELDHYGPRGLAKARMGERPRIDPEAVRPGPARRGLGHPGRSEYPPARAPTAAVAPQLAEPMVILPLANDTLPLPTVEEAAPVGIAAAVTLAGRVVCRAGQRVGRRRERAGRLPTPARRLWLPVRPLPGRGRR